MSVNLDSVFIITRCTERFDMQCFVRCTRDVICRVRILVRVEPKCTSIRPVKES